MTYVTIDQSEQLISMTKYALHNDGISLKKARIMSLFGYINMNITLLYIVFGSYVELGVLFS